MQKDRTRTARLSYSAPDKTLDLVDRRVLWELSENPRLPVAELARRIGMSSPAVAERIRRLEERGVIRGFRLELEPAALGLPLTAYVRVRPNPGRLATVADVARSIPEVVECHRITGEDCFIIKVYLPAMDQLDRVLDQFLLHGTTTTSIVQSSPVPLRPLPLSDE